MPKPDQIPPSDFGKAQDLKTKGKSFRSSGRYKESLECFKKALEFYPRDAGAWFHQGSIYDILGNLEAAIKCYRKAVGLLPDYTRPLEQDGPVRAILRSPEWEQRFLSNPGIQRSSGEGSSFIALFSFYHVGSAANASN